MVTRSAVSLVLILLVTAVSCQTISHFHASRPVTSVDPMLSTDDGTIILAPAVNGTVKLVSTFSFLTEAGDEVYSEDVLQEQAACKQAIGGLKDDLQDAEDKCNKGMAELQSQIDFMKKFMKPCPSGHFSVRDPTPSTDRQCKSHRGPCTANSYESVSPSPTNDRVCVTIVSKPCEANHWLIFAATPYSPQRCAKHTVCQSSQYQTKAPTPTSDRMCSTLKSCVLGKTYQTKTPTATSDRICGNVRGPCASGEQEVKPTLTSNRVCKPAPGSQGCRGGIAMAQEVNKHIWLCSDGAVSNKGYDRMGQQCNNKEGWYLAGVLIHTKIGRPTQTDWAPAAKYMQQKGHDYIMTGQPTRSCSWSDWAKKFQCNGLGYVHVGEGVTGSNWNSLVDGNGKERRSWPAANSPTSHRMPSMCVSAKHIPGAYVYGNYIWRQGDVATAGCKPGIAFAKKITDRMYLCSDGAVTGKGYDRIGQQCNTAAKFNLAGVKIHTKIGRPQQSEWGPAALAMRQGGHDYVITGQATRSCKWASWTGGFNCNGLGYVHLGDSVTSGNWNSLVDGNGAELRGWPSANSPNVHKLPSLCVKADDIPGAYLFGKYIWRLGQVQSGGPGCRSGISHAKKVNDNLWLCSDGAQTGKGYDRVGKACNNAAGFYLADVKVHTKLGAPDASAWSSAAQFMKNAGHDYIITGQAVRSCSWSNWGNNFACNGLGYVSASEGITGSNWRSLVDGNNAERRSWPAANSPTVHRLASMCVKADQIGARLFGKYIWRL